jgi:hypothetical protein
MKFTYPEIRRSSVEVKHKSLTWGADSDRAEVLGVILLVISSYFSSLSSGEVLLRKNTLSVSLASKLVELTV